MRIIFLCGFLCMGLFLSPESFCMEEKAVPLPSLTQIYIPQRVYMTFSHQNEKSTLPDIIMTPLCPCIGVVAKSADKLFVTHLDLATKLESLLDILNEKFKEKDCSISLFTADLTTVPADLMEVLSSFCQGAQARLDTLKNKLSEAHYRNIDVIKFNFENENSLHYSNFTAKSFFGTDDSADAGAKLEDIFSDTPALRPECDDWFDKVEEGLIFKNDVAPLVELTIDQWHSIMADFK